MVVDSSALVAIFGNEPERPIFVDIIEKTSPLVIAAPIYLETAMVIEARNHERGALEFDLFFSKSRIAVVPFTQALAEIARTAFRLYGKGRHRASLNFGDCISYALAKSRGEALLCKGGDFRRTDIEVV